jgi:hypothetical protein
VVLTEEVQQHQRPSLEWPLTGAARAAGPGSGLRPAADLFGLRPRRRGSPSDGAKHAPVA